MSRERFEKWARENMIGTPQSPNYGLAWLAWQAALAEPAAVERRKVRRRVARLGINERDRRAGPADRRKPAEEK